MRKNKILSELKKTAKRSNHDIFRHAAAIVNKNGNIVAKACNNSKFFTHPHSHKYHAETRVLNKVDPNRDLSTCELWVIRINKRGKLRLSEPCDSCKNVINRSGIGFVRYSTGN